MALATTTLSTALTGTGPTAETSIVVASATSIAANRLIQVGGVGGERMIVTKAYVTGSTTVPVRRGQGGTYPQAWPASVNITHGDPSDFVANSAGTDTELPKYMSLASAQYSSTGAISFGTAAFTIAQLIGTSTLAMTLALPTKDQDGQLLMIVGNAKSQSTITTTTAGFNNAGASYDVLTAQNAGNVCVLVVACNGFWNIMTMAGMTGTVTALTVGIA